MTSRNGSRRGTISILKGRMRAAKDQEELQMLSQSPSRFLRIWLLELYVRKSDSSIRKEKICSALNFSSKSICHVISNYQCFYWAKIACRLFPPFNLYKRNSWIFPPQMANHLAILLVQPKTGACLHCNFPILFSTAKVGCLNFIFFVKKVGEWMDVLRQRGAYLVSECLISLAFCRVQIYFTLAAGDNIWSYRVSSPIACSCATDTFDTNKIFMDIIYARNASS